MALQTTQKIWTSGTTLCIAVPRKVCAILGINQGDYVQIDWLEVIKKENLKGEDVKPKRKKEKKEKEKEKVKTISNKDGLETALPDF